MSTLLLWAGLHKVWLFVGMALTMWIASFYLFFADKIRYWRWRGTRHSWTVDMAQRQTYRNNKLEKRAP